MIIKWLHIIFLVLILSSMVMSNNNDTIHRNKRIDHKCKLEEIKTVLKKDIIHRFAKNFNQLENLINRNYCKIDSITLRSYLIQIDTMYKRDSSYSDDDRRMFRKASSFLTRSITWDEEIEKIILKDMDFLKKNSKTIYYRRLCLLVERSPNWYQYMLETYNSIDTFNLLERRMIYRTLIERFKDTSDTSVQNKVESILYAVMKKECSPFHLVDEYFVKTVPGYKNSKQRKEICKKCVRVFKEIPESSSYKRYLRKVEKEMDGTKNFSNYSPPFTID